MATGVTTEVGAAAAVASGLDSRGGGGGRRWGIEKQDLLPGDSFQSWKAYGHALADTKHRLKDRVFACSLDHLELHQVTAVGKSTMKKTLTWWDLTWFGVGSVMGAGIFVLTGEVTRHHAGPAVILSYLIAGAAALLSALCYTEFAVEIPVAGGSFSYLRIELGDLAAYVAAGNILFEYVMAGASVGRSWTSYFATLCGHNPDDFRIHVASLPENYSHLDPIAVVVLIGVCICASLSMKGSSRFNVIATVMHIAVFAFIIAAGLSKAKASNVTSFAPFGVNGIIKSSAMLFFAYIGFDGIVTLGEEVKKPVRDIPVGIIGSVLITITMYCLLAGTLCFMQPYQRLDPDAPFTVAFETVGMDWAKYIVALGALKGMTTVLLANIICQARYFTHIGRTRLAPPFLAAINEKTGTPVNATITMTVTNSVVALFTSLDVLAKLLSIATLFVFTLVALALLVRRYYVTGETTHRDRNRLAGCVALIVGSSVGTVIYRGVVGEKGYWVGYVVSVGVWLVGTVGLKIGVKEARKPRLWGAPLMPWVASACVAVNVFVMGSLDLVSFLRFGVWTAVLLVYYLLVALHASYDAAKEADDQGIGTASHEEPFNVEEGRIPQTHEVCNAEAGSIQHPAADFD